jgi:hypothetical protein
MESIQQAILMKQGGGAQFQPLDSSILALARNGVNNETYSQDDHQ